MALYDAIAQHLTDTGYTIEIPQNFNNIRRQKTQCLRFAEAAAIKKLRLNLCIQKEVVINLSLLR